MMMPPNCRLRNCKHYDGIFGDEPEQYPVCPAFPNGIPEEISWGPNKHTEIHEDQEGTTVYEIDNTE